MGAFDGKTKVKIQEHIFVEDKGDYYELTDDCHSLWRRKAIIELSGTPSITAPGLLSANNLKLPVILS